MTTGNQECCELDETFDTSVGFALRSHGLVQIYCVGLVSLVSGAPNQLIEVT